MKVYIAKFTQKGFRSYQKAAPCVGYGKQMTKEYLWLFKVLKEFSLLINIYANT